jgi:DNA modification methylase
VSDGTYRHGGNTIYHGDVLAILPTLPAGSVHCCVTSPPYFGLRDYGVDGQIGLESTLDEYVAKMVEVFRGVWRVLRDDGCLWLNLGGFVRDGHGWCPETNPDR